MLNRGQPTLKCRETARVGVVEIIPWEYSTNFYKGVCKSLAPNLMVWKENLDYLNDALMDEQSLLFTGIHYMNKSSKSNNNGNARKVSKTKGKGSKPRPKQQPNNNSSGRNVKVPISQGKVSVMSRPQTKNLPNGDILVTHREFIQDVSGSVAFAVTELAINPGLVKVFPWLSQIAHNYESYMFERLEFDYETQCSTVTSGTVLLAVDYDPSDGAPVSKIQALAYRGSVRSPAWNSCSHRSLKEDLSKRKSYFVRNGAIAGAGQAINTYDTGHLDLCTVGQADTNLVGELYVSYTVRLMTPQLSDPSIGSAVYARATGNTSAIKFQNITGGSNLDITITNPDADTTVFTFNAPWEGYMNLSATGTVFLATPVSINFSDLEQALITSNVSNAALTQFNTSINIDANPGNNLTLVIMNATISASLVTFGQANVP